MSYCPKASLMSVSMWVSVWLCVMPPIMQDDSHMRSQLGKDLDCLFKPQYKDGKRLKAFGIGMSEHA